MTEALKPCPFCGGVAKLWPPTYAEDNPSEIIGPAFVNCPDCCVAITGTWEDDAAAAWNRRASLPEAPAVPVAVSIKPMKLSDDRCDYFVSFKCGDREVTPHVFCERFKAEYHVALYRWLFEGGEEPEVLKFGADEWPARTYTDEEQRAFAALLSSPPVKAAAVDEEEEIEIDRLRLAAFKTNSNEDKAAYYLAVSKWFQDRHYRATLASQPAVEGEAVASVIEQQAWDCSTWPDWLSDLVERTNEAAGRLDMSSEQAHAYAALSAVARPSAADAGVIEAEGRRMSETSAVPNPGSVNATMRGCTCPVIDNHCGRGAWGEDFPGVFIYVAGCPLHWPAGSRLGPFVAVGAPTNTGEKP